MADATLTNADLMAIVSIFQVQVDALTGAAPVAAAAPPAGHHSSDNTVMVRPDILEFSKIFPATFCAEKICATHLANLSILFL
jgi:hypothetical protein